MLDTMLRWEPRNDSSRFTRACSKVNTLTRLGRIRKALPFPRGTIAQPGLGPLADLAVPLYSNDLAAHIRHPSASCHYYPFSRGNSCTTCLRRHERGLLIRIK